MVHAGFNGPSRAHRVEHGLQRQRVRRALLQAEVLGHPKWRLRGFFYLRPHGSPSHVGDVKAYVYDKHQPSFILFLCLFPGGDVTAYVYDKNQPSFILFLCLFPGGDVTAYI